MFDALLLNHDVNTWYIDIDDTSRIQGARVHVYCKFAITERAVADGTLSRGSSETRAELLWLWLAPLQVGLFSGYVYCSISLLLVYYQTSD